MLEELGEFSGIRSVKSSAVSLKGCLCSGVYVRETWEGGDHRKTAGPGKAGRNSLLPVNMILPHVVDFVLLKP